MAISPRLTSRRRRHRRDVTNGTSHSPPAAASCPPPARACANGTASTELSYARVRRRVLCGRRRLLRSSAPPSRASFHHVFTVKHVPRASFIGIVTYTRITQLPTLLINIYCVYGKLCCLRKLSSYFIMNCFDRTTLKLKSRLFIKVGKVLKKKYYILNLTTTIVVRALYFYSKFFLVL